MENLRSAFLSKGYVLPEFIRKLIENSSSRKQVYKRLWAVVVFVGKLGDGKRTFSFPIELREAVRERFPDSEAGSYDSQYEGNESVYHVSIEELAVLPYPPMKK